MKRGKDQTATGKRQAQARLAEALRDNLRKRKAQARARSDRDGQAAKDSSPGRRKA